MVRAPSHHARTLRSALVCLAKLTLGTSVAVTAAGCCAWPFEEASSGYSTSTVVTMPLAIVRAGYRLDEPLPPATCQRLCNQDDCFPSAAVGASGAPSAVVVCNAYHPRSCRDSGFLSFRMPSGRRAARLGADPTLAFTALAGAEAASVVDFERLEVELRAHHAPASLLARARRAMADEVRHDASMRRLARAEGRAKSTTPSPLARRHHPGATRSLRRLAIDNVIRGCVGETWGALLLEIGARRAGALEARGALATIARDEARHASLAFAIHRWVEPRLTAADRAAVQAAFERAAARLVRERPRVAPAVRVALGLPSVAEHARLAPAVLALVGARLSPG